MLTPIRTLEIVAFLDLLAAGLIVPQIPHQARELGCNYLLVGFIGAIYSGFQLLSGPMTGSLSDIQGRTVILLLSLSLSGVAYMLLGLTSSIVLFLGLRSVLGITKHTQLLTKAIAPDYIDDKNQLSEVYGTLSTLKQVGMSLGPIIGGHIMEFYPEEGFTLIGFIVAGIFAINAGLIQKLPKQEKEEKSKSKANDKAALAPTLINSVTTNFNQSVEQFYKIDWTSYGEVFLLRLLISLCIGVYVSNYVLFLKIKHNVTPITIGYIISFFSAIGSITTYFISHINNYYVTDKDFTERNFHVFGLLTISLLGVILAPTVSTYIAFLIPLGVSAAVGRLATLEMVLNKTDGELRGTVLGVANNIRSLSGVLAPIVAGFVGQYVGMLYVMYVSVLLAAVGTYKSYIVRSKTVEVKKK